MSDWTYINGESIYTPSLSQAIAELTYDKYGEEHDDAVRDLKTVADAAVREAVKKIRDHAFPAHETDGSEAAADLIDPDKP